MIVIPKLEKLLAYTSNDYEVIKLNGFFQNHTLDNPKFVLLYKEPNINNGALINVPADFGPTLDIVQTHQYLYYKNNTADLRSSKHPVPTNPKDTCIFALVLTANNRNLVVFKLKRPITITKLTNFATIFSEVFALKQGQPFRLTKFNAPFNKTERVYGHLTTNANLTLGQAIVGTHSGEKPLSEEAEWQYVKVRAENLIQQIPFEAIDGQYYNAKNVFTSDVSSTATNKTYQIQGVIEIPSQPSKPPTAIMVKPKSADGMEDSLCLVLYKFDGFGRGGKFNLSLIIQME